MTTDSDIKKNLTQFAVTASEQVREVKKLVNGNVKTLAELNTEEKTNLVAAINEVLRLAKNPVSFEDVDVAVQDYFVLHPQTYTHEQGVAASTWLITHPLDHRPAVTVLDSAGTIWRGQVSYPAQNQVLIQFNLALAGKAVLT